MQNSPLTQINALSHGIKLLTLAGALAAPVVAWASSPVLKGDSYATSASATVHGAEPSILINPSNTGYLQYGLGLSLPTGTTGQDIDKATLKVYVSSVTTSGTLTIRKVTSVWNESTLSETNLPTVDLVTVPKTFSIPKSFAGKFVQLDVTDLVKDWADSPSTNFGLALSVESGSLLSFAIDSKENTGTGHEAYLDVVLKNKSTAGPVPNIVINEVDYNNPITDDAEFIEIYNPTTAPVNLSGVFLILINGFDGSIYRSIDLSSFITLPSGGYLVAGDSSFDGTLGVPFIDLGTSNQIQNGAPDGIALFNAKSSSFIDTLSYDGNTIITNIIPFPISSYRISLVEGAATSAIDDAINPGSLIRNPNGADTNDDSADWTFTTTPTPGSANLLTP